MSLLSFTKKISGGAKKRKKPAAKKDAVGASKTEASGKREQHQGSVAVALQIGLQPVMTEKGVLLSETSTGVFRVAPTASKQQIAQAVREKYKVEPRRVRTMQMRAKRRKRGRTEGRTAMWKKAYVTVDDVQALNAGP